MSKDGSFGINQDKKMGSSRISGKGRTDLEEKMGLGIRKHPGAALTLLPTCFPVDSAKPEEGPIAEDAEEPRFAEN